MKSKKSRNLNDIQNNIADWEKQRGRVMKSYLPTQDIVSLLNIAERLKDKSAEEEELIQKTRELIQHAIELLSGA